MMSTSLFLARARALAHNDVKFWAELPLEGTFVRPLSSRGVRFVRCPKARGCPYLGVLNACNDRLGACTFYGGCHYPEVLLYMYVEQLQLNGIFTCQWKRKIGGDNRQAI